MAPALLTRQATRALGSPAARSPGKFSVGISVVAVVETAHVLRTPYGVARSDVLDVLIELLTRQNMELLGLPKQTALSAFVRARSLPGSPIPDALIAATAEWAKAVPV